MAGRSARERCRCPCAPRHDLPRGAHKGRGAGGAFKDAARRGWCQEAPGAPRGSRAAGGRERTLAGSPTPPARRPALAPAGRRAPRRGGRGRSWEQSGGRGASEPCDREGPGRETRRESAGLPGRPGAGSRPPAPRTGGPNAGGSVWRGAPLPAVPSPSPKGGKSRRGAPRLDLAPLSSIFCLMSPGPIVGEGTRHPGHKFTVMAPPAASQF